MADTTSTAPTAPTFAYEKNAIVLIQQPYPRGGQMLCIGKIIGRSVDYNGNDSPADATDTVTYTVAIARPTLNDGSGTGTPTTATISVKGVQTTTDVISVVSDSTIVTKANKLFGG